MHPTKYWRIGIGVLALLLATGLLAQSSERWHVVRSPHLFVALRSDLLPEFFSEDGVLDRLGALKSKVAEMERRFQQVERLLEADYDPVALGRVPVLVYPNLETYQLAVDCLICAAHVGRPLWQPQSDEEPLLEFGAHLNLQSTDDTIFHEFVHVVDFAAVDNAAAPMWYEGLAAYIGTQLLGDAGQPQLDILPQYLKQYQQTHVLSLGDYLTRPSYGRWTYNLGANLIDVLVRRGGLSQFMRFYRDLNRPGLDELGVLFQTHYGLSLGEVERLWQAQLDRTQTTEDGQFAYRFKFDQIVLRWVYLRPILKDPLRLDRAYFNLWVDGGFDRGEAQFMRDYLTDYGNMAPSAEAVEALLQNAQQLRGYVRTYAEDPARQDDAERALGRLETACGGGPAACARAYFDLIHTFVRWE